MKKKNMAEGEKKYREEGRRLDEMTQKLYAKNLHDMRIYTVSIYKSAGIAPKETKFVLKASMSVLSSMEHN